MSTPTNDGGPAFPCGEDVTQNLYAPSAGLSMRNYFAAKAMQGLLGALDLQDGDAPSSVSQMSYMVADAMIKARSES